MDETITSYRYTRPPPLEVNGRRNPYGFVHFSIKRMMILPEVREFIKKTQCLKHLVEYPSGKSKSHMGLGSLCLTIGLRRAVWSGRSR